MSKDREPQNSGQANNGRKTNKRVPVLGLVVMAGDSCSRVHGIESQHCIL